MPGVGEEALAVDGAVAEGRLGLAARGLDGLVQVLGALDDAHPAPPATGGRLDEQRKAQLLGRPGRKRRDARGGRDPLGLELVSAPPQGGGGRPDPRQGPPRGRPRRSSRSRRGTRSRGGRAARLPRARRRRARRRRGRRLRARSCRRRAGAARPRRRGLRPPTSVSRADGTSRRCVRRSRRGSQRGASPAAVRRTTLSAVRARPVSAQSGSRVPAEGRRGLLRRAHACVVRAASRPPRAFVAGRPRRRRPSPRAHPFRAARDIRHALRAEEEREDAEQDHDLPHPDPERHSPV